MTQVATKYTDDFRLTDAATDETFTLLGGKYGVLVSATFGGGSVTLKGLAADNTTYVTVLTAFTAAGYASVDLPPGSYQIDITTATAVYVTVSPIPIRTH